MILSELPQAELVARLAGKGLCVRTGPFTVRVRSTLPHVARGLVCLYDRFEVPPSDNYCDLHVELRPGQGLRRWLRPQVEFFVDGKAVYQPFPQDHALPLLEWGINWGMASHVNDHLLIHSAVVERDGLALVLPAPPGSGKSTLCAGLVHRGWRLLSDETAVIGLDDARVWPLARPVSLKNRSINVIRDFAGELARFGPPTHGTIKGTVIHMRAPDDALTRMHESARVRWLVFPRWEHGVPMRLTPRAQADTMIDLCGHSFNYARLGHAGFQAMTRMIDGCRCFDFHYGQLNDAVACFDDLVSQEAVRA